MSSEGKEEGICQVRVVIEGEHTQATIQRERMNMVMMVLLGLGRRSVLMMIVRTDVEYGSLGGLVLDIIVLNQWQDQL